MCLIRREEETRAHHTSLPDIGAAAAATPECSRDGKTGGDPAPSGYAFRDAVWDTH